MASWIRLRTSTAVELDEFSGRPRGPNLNIRFTRRVYHAKQSSCLEVSQQQSGEGVDGLIRVLDMEEAVRVALLQVPDEGVVNRIVSAGSPTFRSRVANSWPFCLREPVRFHRLLSAGLRKHIRRAQDIHQHGLGLAHA